MYEDPRRFLLPCFIDFAAVKQCTLARTQHIVRRHISLWHSGRPLTIGRHPANCSLPAGNGQQQAVVPKHHDICLLTLFPHLISPHPAVNAFPPSTASSPTLHLSQCSACLHPRGPHSPQIRAVAVAAAPTTPVNFVTSPAVGCGATSKGEKTP